MQFSNISDNQLWINLAWPNSKDSMYFCGYHSENERLQHNLFSSTVSKAFRKMALIVLFIHFINEANLHLPNID